MQRPALKVVFAFPLSLHVAPLLLQLLLHLALLQCLFATLPPVHLVLLVNQMAQLALHPEGLEGAHGSEKNKKQKTKNNVSSLHIAAVRQPASSVCPSRLTLT